jgi:2-haloalkanoic acid dehalogenase type II
MNPALLIHSSINTMTELKHKAVFFDFMGTCLDWHTGVINIFPQSIEQSARSKLALEWRQDYFDSNSARLKAQQPPEDIDITLRRTFQTLLRKHPEYQDLFDDELLDKCVAQWHSMPAWPEVPLAIKRIKAAGFQTFVFANGTTCLQLDLCQSSGLAFDMLFSSALLGVYKPAPESYHKVLELVKLKPEETIMVAAHAYDLRGAKNVGMHTVYISRWTDDIEEDFDSVKKENDFSILNMTQLPEIISKMQV